MPHLGIHGTQFYNLRIVYQSSITLTPERWDLGIRWCVNQQIECTCKKSKAVGSIVETVTDLHLDKATRSIQNFQAFISTHKLHQGEVER